MTWSDLSHTHTHTTWVALIWKTEHTGQDRSRGGKRHNRWWWPALHWQPERGWKTSRVWRYLGKTFTVEHETRRRMKENTKIWGLKTWKKEVPTYWDGEDYRRSRTGKGNKLGFFNVGLDNSLQCLLVRMMMSGGRVCRCLSWRYNWNLLSRWNCKFWGWMNSWRDSG